MRRSFNLSKNMAFKASITIHKSPKGKLTVLEASEDADKCLQSFIGCKEPGELQYHRSGRLEKSKKIPVVEKKATKKATK